MITAPCTSLQLLAYVFLLIHDQMTGNFSEYEEALEADKLLFSPLHECMGHVAFQRISHYRTINQPKQPF